MITAILATLCAIYFAYVKKWAETYLSREYHFSSPAPPKVLPHYTPLSIVIGLVFAILLLHSFLHPRSSDIGDHCRPHAFLFHYLSRWRDWRRGTDEKHGFVHERYG